MRVRILMVHVGNAIEAADACSDSRHLIRRSLLDDREYCFDKADIVNADVQMESLRRSGVEIQYGHVSDRRSVKGFVAAGLKIRKITMSGLVDVVHVLWGSSTALAAICFSHVPVVISFCGSDLLGSKDKFGKTTVSGRLSKWLSHLASHLSAANITKSVQMRAVLSRSAAARTTVIPNGVDRDLFKPMDRRQARAVMGITHDRPIVLFFYAPGQFVKNPGLAEAAFALIRRDRPEAELLTVSGVQHEDLNLYYNASDVMIVTSFHEGSNNSIKEANACNLPIVSVPVGDAADRLAGVSESCVVERHDASLIAAKVVEILATRNRSNGREKSHDVSLESIAGRVIDVYRQVLTRANA